MFIVGSLFDIHVHVTAIVNGTKWSAQSCFLLHTHIQSLFYMYYAFRIPVIKLKQSAFFKILTNFQSTWQNAILACHLHKEILHQIWKASSCHHRNGR